jgi:hypothetical protein
LPAEAVTNGEPSFVPIVTQTRPEGHNNGGVGAPAAADGVVEASIGSCIEIRLAGALIRVTTGTNCALLAEVLRALRTSAA